MLHEDYTFDDEFLADLAALDLPPRAADAIKLLKRAHDALILTDDPLLVDLSMDLGCFLYGAGGIFPPEFDERW